MFVHPDNTIDSIIWPKITFEGHFDAQRVDVISKVHIEGQGISCMKISTRLQK